MKKCYICKGTVEEAHVRVVREREGKLFVLEHVPTQLCRDCGERYFQGWVLEEMDRLVSSDVSMQQEIRVPVMRFDRELVA